MSPICKDKTSQYDIRPDDLPLIKASIQLGKWIAARPEITPDELCAVNQVLDILNNLPNPPPVDFDGGFEFQILPLDELWDGGNYLGLWSVDIDHSFIEISSCFPDDQNEFGWSLCPGESNRNNPSYAEDWIKEVSDPEKLLLPDLGIFILAETWLPSNKNNNTE